MHGRRPRTERALALAGLLLAALSAVGCGGSGGGGGSSAGAAPPAPVGPPTLVSVSPTSAPVGVTVTVTGLDFDALLSGNALFWNDVEAVVDAASPSEIVCRVPRGLGAGPASITLATRGGSSAAPLAFTVLAGAPGAPVLTSIAPQVAHVGEQVTLTGSGFGPSPAANTVTLAGRACPIVSGSATTLVVTVPAGAKAGKLVVTSPAGASSLGRTLFVTSAQPAPLGQTGAGNLLYARAVPATHLLVECDFESGLSPAPTQGGLDDLRGELARVLRKPGGVLVLRKPIFPPTGVLNWTTPALIQNDLAVRAHYDGPNCAVMHMSFVGGRFEEPDVIGLAYGTSSISIFHDRLTRNIGPFGQALVEAAVEVHECGHLLGLVDLGTPMQTLHEDAAGSHDVSDACVMFASIATDRVTVRIDPPPATYDAKCVEDLRAIGGK